MWPNSQFSADLVWRNPEWKASFFCAVCAFLILMAMLFNNFLLLDILSQQNPEPSQRSKVEDFAKITAFSHYQFLQEGPT